MIEVRPVNNRRMLGQFIDFPYTKYRAHRHWTPQLRLSEWQQFNPARNPFFVTADMQLFVALDGNRVSGRIAAIDDRRHNEVHRDNVGMFGFFEADSPEGAAALLAAAEQWARSRGRAALRGPLNPSLNYSAGLQVDAFDTDPFVMMPCNPPEYAQYIERGGYAKVMDLYAWLFDLRQPLPDKFTRLVAQSEHCGPFVVRPVDFSDFPREMDKLLQVYSRAWEANWGFVPPTREEFQHIAADLKQVAIPEGVLLAESGGSVIGCAIGLPDINQVLKGTGGRLFPVGLARFVLRKRLVSRARLLLFGVLPEFRDTEVLVLLFHRIHAFAIAMGYTSAELSWTLESNEAVNRTIERGGATRYKTYRLYQRPLDGAL
jgi:GNAT superfamily N-acetyltransferase